MNFLHKLTGFLFFIFLIYFNPQASTADLMKGEVLDQVVSNEHISTRTVNSQLREIITVFLERNPYLSLNGFAKNSGVSSTTLRRIVNDVTKNEPAPHTILNIVSYITKEKKISKLLDKIDGPIKEVLSKCFAQYTFEVKAHSYALELNTILKDYSNYLIYKLAANVNGTSQLDIYEALGALGREKLKNLLKIGVVELKDDERIYACDPNFSIDLQIAKEHLPNLVSFYEPEQVHKGENIFYSLSESVNHQGIQKIKDILRSAASEVHEIMSDTQYQGDIPFFSIVLADSLKHTPESQEVLQ